MKKCLLLFCLLVGIQHAFAAFTQGKWRWRKDDGSETAATFLAPENTPPANITSYDILRLRTELYYVDKDSQYFDIKTLGLKYSLTGNNDTWISITNDANQPFVFANSAYVSDSAATTQLLTPRSGYTFQPGRVVSSTSAYTFRLYKNHSTEFEFIIKPTAAVGTNQTYYFEVSDGLVDQPFASFTTASALPVNLLSFGVTEAQNRAVVKWTTANEINNDHFEVLRSQNGQSWQAIANVQAKGGNMQNSYEFTDNTPLNGNSYYRLKQVDKDGRTALSDVKNFSLKNLKNIAAAIYPNPTAAGINIMLNSYTGTVTATVTNTQGAIVHRQVIAATASTSAYKLNLNQKLAPGTYYVNLSGTDLSQKLKVIVQ